MWYMAIITYINTTLYTHMEARVAQSMCGVCPLRENPVDVG